MRSFITIMFILIMTTCLVGSVYASYAGIGINEVGRSSLTDPSVRDNSVGGPRIVGGGPGSGK